MADDDRQPAMVRRSRGRPRSAASRRAALDAAYAILVEEGLARFTVDAVAARSGVAKTTIYRYWPSKGALAFESFREVFERQITFDRTNSPEDDLYALVRSLVQTLGGQDGRVAASAMAEAQSDDDIRTKLVEVFAEPLRRRTTELVRAGIVAGQFRSDLEVRCLLDALVGAVYLRLLVGEPMDDAWSDALVRTVLMGAHGA